jgi:hypothetical protein
MKTSDLDKLFFAALLSLAVLNAFAAPGDVVRISKNGNNYSYTEWSTVNHISADGCYAVFYSFATNLDSADTDNRRDVYAYDCNNDTVELMSRRSASDGGAKAGALNNDPTWGHLWASQEPSISADGRYVAFWTTANNLSSSDTDYGYDIYVYDRDTDNVELVSRRSASAGGAKANSFSLRPSISADGRYVAFMSGATNLDPADTNANYDIYVYDRDTDTVELVSRRSASAGGGVANTQSFNPSISADGRYIAFWTQATNLDSADTDLIQDVYVYDRDTDTIELVSRKSASAGGAKANNGSQNPSISANGRYVAFESYANNLDSADANPLDAGVDVYVYDRDTDTVELISRQSNGGVKGNSVSAWTSINADGRYVAFGSAASNLISGQTTNALGGQIYVYDRQTHTHHLMSENASGIDGNNSSYYPSISADGTRVVFTSYATNLVNIPGPLFYTQVFIKETGLPASGTNQPPVANAGSDQTVEATSNTGALVTLNGAGSTDPDAGDSLVSYVWTGDFGTASGVSPTIPLPLDTHTVTLTVTDESGATDDDTVVVTVVDTTPPSLSCPANVTGVVGQAVNLGSPTISDIADPSPSVSNNAPASYAPGTTSVTWTATDHSSNSASCTQSVTLLYDFQGFFSPVDNPPVVNTVKNGATVPLKWRLADAAGNYITDITTVVESKYTSSICGGVEDPIEETAVTGGTALRWDESGQQFIYSWKTPALPGKCIRLDVKLNDGRTISAMFRLK